MLFGDASTLTDATSSRAQLAPPVAHAPTATDSARPYAAPPTTAALVTVAPAAARSVVSRTYADASVVGAIAPMATFAAMTLVEMVPTSTLDTLLSATSTVFVTIEYAIVLLYVATPRDDVNWPPLFRTVDRPVASIVTESTVACAIVLDATARAPMAVKALPAPAVAVTCTRLEFATRGVFISVRYAIGVPDDTTPTTATWLQPPVPITADTVELCATNTLLYTVLLHAVAPLPVATPTTAAETLAATPFAVAITLLLVAASVTDCTVTIAGDRYVSAAKPTTAMAEVPLYEMTPPIARASLRCASAVTFVAVIDPTAALADADHANSAAPSTATLDCDRAVLAFATIVELHAPISTFVMVMLPVADEVAKATPTAETALHAGGPPRAVTVVLPPTVIVTFDNVAVAFSHEKTLTPRTAVATTVFVVVPEQPTAVAFAELAIMFTLTTVANALPEMEFDTMPPAATALL